MASWSQLLQLTVTVGSLSCARITYHWFESHIRGIYDPSYIQLETPYPVSLFPLNGRRILSKPVRTFPWVVDRASAGEQEVSGPHHTKIPEKMVLIVDMDQAVQSQEIGSDSFEYFFLIGQDVFALCG